MADIFISYRVQDSKPWALMLRDELSERFGAARVFFDQDDLRAGSWRTQIRDELERCRVFVLVIGPRWLRANASDLANAPARLLDPADVHRQEIERALARPGVTVIPVLVDGATLPAASDLPPSLQHLLESQARRISDGAGHRRLDLDVLGADIRPLIGIADVTTRGPETRLHEPSGTPITLDAARPRSAASMLSGPRGYALAAVLAAGALGVVWQATKPAAPPASSVTIQGSAQAPVIVGNTIGTLDNRTVVVERPKTTVAPTDVMRRLLPGTPESAIVSLLGPPSRTDGDIAVYNRLDNLYLRIVFNFKREVCSTTLQLRDSASVFEMFPIDVYHLGRTTMHDVFGKLTLQDLPNKESDWFPKGGNYASVTENFGAAGQHFTYTFGISKQLEGSALEALPHAKEIIDFVTVTGENCPLALRSGLRHFEYQ